MFGTNKLAVSLIGVTSLGAIGTAGAYSAGLFDITEKKEKIIKTIADRLEKEGFTLINEEGEWTTLKSKHKATKKDIFEGEDKDKIDLKNKCTTILNKEPNDSSYKLARKWCVKEQKIKDILKKGNYKILDSVESNKGDDTTWKQKIDLLKSNLEKFKALKDKITTPDKPDGNNIKEFKKACLNLAIETTLTTTDTFDENFDLAREWCSIKKDDTNN